MRHLILRFLLFLIELGSVDVIIGDACGHHALTGVFIQATATTSAFVLGCALPKDCTTRTGDADKSFLTAFEFFNVGGLIVVPAIITDIIGIAFLIVIILGKACVQHTLEGGQVHGVGIEDVFKDFFFHVPRMGDGDAIGIGFLGLLAALADDIGTHPVGEGVAMAGLCLALEHLDTLS